MDLGRCPEVSHDRLKLSVYDDARAFRRNYKTVVSKAKALHQAIGGDLEEGLVSAPFLNRNYLGDSKRFILTTDGRK